MTEVIDPPKPVRTGVVPQSEDTIKKSEAFNRELFDDEPAVEEETEIETQPNEEIQPQEIQGKKEEQKSQASVEDRVAAAVEEGLRRVQPQVQAPVREEPKLTPEQEDELLGRWKPSEDVLKMLDSEDQAVRLNALTHVRDGVLKQALTMAKFMIQSEVDKVRGELNPLQETSQRVAVEKGREEFYTTYPALKDAKYLRLIQLATAELKGENFTPDSKEKAFEAIATRTEKFVKEFDPNFELSKPTVKQPTTKAKTTMPKQAVTSPGGGGGTASTAPEPKANRSSGVEVFD